MKTKTNNYRYIQLQKWYKKPSNTFLKKIILDEALRLRDLNLGNNALFIGLTEFRRKFNSKKYLSYISFDELSLTERLISFKRLPFEDKSHDIIIMFHALDYTDNPYELIREINRIATEDAKIILIGFNKISLWGLLKPFMKKEESWASNYHSIYNIQEWFKLLNYEQLEKQTTCFLPFVPRLLQEILSKLRFLQRIFFNRGR